MGQFFGIEKIPQLTYSGGNIILPAGAEFKIGGQGYRTTTSLSVSVGSLAALTMYYVYAIISSGVPALVISTNVNSVGPSGYTKWRLVGAFCSNGAITPAFNGFVSLTSPAQFASAPVMYLGSILWTSSTAWSATPSPADSFTLFSDNATASSVITGPGHVLAPVSRIPGFRLKQIWPGRIEIVSNMYARGVRNNTQTGEVWTVWNDGVSDSGYQGFQYNDLITNTTRTLSFTGTSGFFEYTSNRGETTFQMKVRGYDSVLVSGGNISVYYHPNSVSSTQLIDL